MDAEAVTRRSRPEWLNKLFGSAVLGLALYGGYKLLFSESEKQAPGVASVTATTPAKPTWEDAPASPPTPAHQYSLHEEGNYGYEQAISDDDQKHGLVTKPLLMVRYLGKKRDEYTVEMRDGGTRYVYSCQDPCEFVKTRVYLAGELMGENTVRNTPGSVMNAVMQDAMAGQLEPYQKLKPTPNSTEE